MFILPSFSIKMKKWIRLLPLLYLIFHTTAIFSQHIITDSLQSVLKQSNSTAEQKAIAMAELAQATVEQNLDNALRTGRKAIEYSKQKGTENGKAFSYATMSYLLVRKNQIQQATTYQDSAMMAATRASDQKIIAFVQMRKGWLDMIKGDHEKAISSLLKAKKLLEKLNDPKSCSYKSMLNRYIANIYAYGKDNHKQKEYARESLLMAKKSGFPDDLQMAYITTGQNFLSSFERNTSNRALLDSSLHYNQMALQLYKQAKDRILLPSNTATPALNTANIYFMYYPSSYKANVHQYINIALQIARKTNDREVIASCYGMLSEYSLKENNYEQAEKYLKTGLTEIEGDAFTGNITRSRLMQAMANVAEKSGNSMKALDYYKKYMDYSKKVFDAQKLTITQQLEEQYQAKKKEDEITRLTERSMINKKLNWLYLILGTSAIIVLGLLFSSYRYKLKASILNQTLLQERKKWLEKELLTGTLQIQEKNEILQSLRQKSISTSDTVTTKQIDRIIDQNLRMDKKLETHQRSVASIHPDFFSALQNRANNSLTPLDIKYCSYILIGLDNKEIAVRLNIEPKSIRMARYRIKKKLGLDKDESLFQVITSFDRT